MTISTAARVPLLDPDSVDLFALLCQRRGWSDNFLKQVEQPEHDELLGTEAIVEALESARTQGHKITIAPDFDMDGITSGVLGYAGLSELGFNVELHLPDYRRGHDLTPADIAEINRRWPDTKVLLTCDGGVNSHHGIAAARALGWKTLVTDHHTELAPGSSADVTVNPCRIEETYAHPGICGAHVLYQVLESYTRIYQPNKTWEIGLLRLFAGLGTVSDVMPLLFENRQLVRDSISIARLLRVPAPLTIPNRYKSFDPDPDAIDISAATLLQLLNTSDHHPVFWRAFEGFASMLKAFAQNGNLRDIDDLDEEFYAFYLAPAMNAPRRIGSSLQHCFDVFTAATPQDQLEAAQSVILGNERRKELTILHTAELIEGDQPLAPWVYFSDAPPGMYGLLANKMMEQNGHPVVVMNRPMSPADFVAGSGRAPAWFEIIATLEPHAGMWAIGHQQACGVKVERAELLTDLVTVLREATQVALLNIDTTERVGDLVLGPDEDCDADLDDLSPLAELIRRVELLKPFGHGFTEPVVEIALGLLNLKVTRMGSSPECTHPQTAEHGSQNFYGDWICQSCKPHLRLTTPAGLAAVWWNSADEHFTELIEICKETARFYDQRAVLASLVADQSVLVTNPNVRETTVTVDEQLAALTKPWTPNNLKRASVTEPTPELKALKHAATGAATHAFGPDGELRPIATPFDNDED